MSSPQTPPIPFSKEDGRWESRAQPGPTYSAPQEALVGADALAKILALSPSHVRRLARKRKIPFYKAGSALRFDVDEVKRALRKEAVVHG